MTFNIIPDRKERRATHWREIQTRVTTHEGEFLHGEKGKKYQKKWSRQYLGRDLSKQSNVTAETVERYEKTGR